MRISPLVLLLFATLGCGSGTDSASTSAKDDGNQAQPQNVATPEGQAEPLNPPKPTESESTENAALAAVKNHMTPAQLALGDPVVNSIGMIFVPIPPGQFQMGSPDSDKRSFIDDEKPQHLVKISNASYLSAFEVTQQQYEQVMKASPWQGQILVQAAPNNPATYVTYADATEFCRRLSEQEGVEYRLPTEAEWEYACRAGTTTVYSFGDDASKLGQYAWYQENSREGELRYPHRVGQKLPNPWGLYDMHGNAAEWCQDWYGPYNNETETDPTGPAQGQFRVLRGASFGTPGRFISSTDRIAGGPMEPSFNVGFRPLRTYGATP